MTLLMTLFLAVLTALGPGGDDEPDSIVTVKGKTLKGRIVYQDGEKVILRIKSRTEEIPREEIAEISSVIRSLDDVLDRFASLGDDDVAGTLELADACQAAGLPDEAELLRLRVLLLDPANTAANEALGNRESKSVWKYKRGKKLVPTEDLASLGETWKDRWDLQTTHFVLQSNLALWDGIVACLDLERTYRSWYDLVSEGLTVYDVTEPMEAHLHADTGSYPEPGDGRPGYFDAGNRILNLLSENGPPDGILAHEAVHQFIYMTSVREKGMSGQVPQWLNEGLAVYFDTSSERVNGKLKFELGKPGRQKFADHVGAEKRFELRRLLTMDSGDFMASTHTAAKYGHAYSLVHYLLHGNEEAYRPIFFDVLSRAYAGQGSMSDFKKALDERDIDMDEFEESWNAYAEQQAH